MPRALVGLLARNKIALEIEGWVFVEMKSALRRPQRLAARGLGPAAPHRLSRVSLLVLGSSGHFLLIRMRSYQSTLS